MIIENKAISYISFITYKLLIFLIIITKMKVIFGLKQLQFFSMINIIQIISVILIRSNIFYIGFNFKNKKTKFEGYSIPFYNIDQNLLLILRKKEKLKLNVILKYNTDQLLTKNFSKRQIYSVFYSNNFERIAFTLEILSFLTNYNMHFEKISHFFIFHY